MNYEVKSISPLRVLGNATRLFMTLGFLVGVYQFFLNPASNITMPALWQKAAATALFTVVYTLVVVVIFVSLGRLYNAWVRDFNLRSFFMEVLPVFLILSFLLSFAAYFLSPSERPMFARLLSVVVFTLGFGSLMSLLVTGITALCTAIVGKFKGLTVHLEQE